MMRTTVAILLTGRACCNSSAILELSSVFVSTVMKDCSVRTTTLNSSPQCMLETLSKRMDGSQGLVVHHVRLSSKPGKSFVHGQIFPTQQRRYLWSRS